MEIGTFFSNAVARAAETTAKVESSSVSDDSSMRAEWANADEWNTHRPDRSIAHSSMFGSNVFYVTTGCCTTFTCRIERLSHMKKTERKKLKCHCWFVFARYSDIILFLFSYNLSLALFNIYYRFLFSFRAYLNFEFPILLFFCCVLVIFFLILHFISIEKQKKNIKNFAFIFCVFLQFERIRNSI